MRQINEDANLMFKIFLIDFDYTKNLRGMIDVK
jgi:hypothetical protein